MRQHAALAYFEDGLPMTKIQYAKVASLTPRIAAQSIRNMVQYGYLVIKDYEAREMKTPRYLGERFVITLVGIERLRMMDPPKPVEEFVHETTVQRAIRTQPTSVWELAA